jgi:hypothetical protein
MTLDYAILDDLLDVSRERVTTALATLGTVDVGEIGPLVEYAYLCRQNQFSHLPPLRQLTTAPAALAVEGSFGQAAHSPAGSSLAPLSVEVVRVPANIADNPHWTAFFWRLVNAAKRAGFDDLMAKGFGGAFGELADNVFQHSQHPETAIAAYRWQDANFEMVIADAGIGIRSSLRENPDYAQISDDNAALETATTMGVSRFGAGTGRGTGFKTVFDAIAGTGCLRFRSGIAALILNRTDNNLVRRRSLQRKHFGGMFASICCRAA